jgi:endonuclease YncB( thermonuclease family)
MKCIVIFFFLFFPASLLASCPRYSLDETVIVKKINDGDTVTLDSGRLVRFIGINTPEINHRNLSKSEPYALEAKALLERYIRPGDKIKLLYDKTKQDKYGRKLAYVFSKTGRNLALLLLKAGLAKHWVIGKNDLLWRCFQDAERQARIRGKAVWSDFKPLNASRVKTSDKGYVYVSGRVTDVDNNKKGMTLMLDKKLSIFISSAKLKMFKANNIDIHLYNKLLLTGKLFFSKGKPRIKLYHPAQILP